MEWIVICCQRTVSTSARSLPWRHNGCGSVSNHQPHDCLLSRLFRRRSKKTSKLRVTGLCAGSSPGTGEFPHKWPVTRKIFPFDDVIKLCVAFELIRAWWRIPTSGYHQLSSMATIFQAAFSNTRSWMKMYEFRLRFHWSLFPGV